jgi:Ulp1 family protease
MQLLLPIVDNGHWVLVCINFLCNQINFFDSIHGADGLDTDEIAKRVVITFIFFILL